ncbi:MAG: hypothetical protein Q9208_004637 [Pyrenodesmia sp. 3 TL-2023]
MSSSPSASSQPPTRICVFCGSKPGASPAHLAAARALAHSMHDNGIHLVYGGGTTGMMGEVARTLVKLSGPDAVMGVIPSKLLNWERPAASEGEEKAAEETEKMKTTKKKIPRSWLLRMGQKGGDKGGDEEEAKLLLNEEYGHVKIVPDIQIRKKYMMELVRDGGPGSGFVALSGAIGTLDELMEVVSWNQMGAHKRGSCFLNVDGYWDGVIQWVDKVIEEKFAGENVRHILGSVKEAGEVVGWLKGYDKGRASE